MVGLTSVITVILAPSANFFSTFGALAVYGLAAFGPVPAIFAALFSTSSALAAYFLAGLSFFGFDDSILSAILLSSNLSLMSSITS